MSVYGVIVAPFYYGQEGDPLFILHHFDGHLYIYVGKYVKDKCVYIVRNVWIMNVRWGREKDKSVAIAYSYR